jgi:hypothetical protein
MKLTRVLRCGQANRQVRFGQRTAVTGYGNKGWPRAKFAAAANRLHSTGSHLFPPASKKIFIECHKLFIESVLQKGRINKGRH